MTTKEAQGLPQELVGETIARFDPGDHEMVREETGYFVRYSDYRSLSEANAALEVERDRCHERLEIDHVFVIDDNDDNDLVRREIPLEDRAAQIDGIECRDATISCLEDALSAATLEIERLKGALEPFALMSSEGIVKNQIGYVTVTSCAEYFHRARTALAASKAEAAEGNDLEGGDDERA